jgi:hypothetical protein
MHHFDADAGAFPISKTIYLVDSLVDTEYVSDLHAYVRISITGR